MIEVRGSKSENRWSQTEHEIFQPLPVKMLTVSPSGFGKTSVILAAADALFEHMDYWAIFSKSHMLDPAWQELIARIRHLYRRRGYDESEQPFLFENMDHLAKVLQTQKQRVQELKEAEDVHRLPMLCVILDDIGLEATKYSRTIDNGFAMSRHYGTNWLCGSQLWRSLSVAVRKNADMLTIHRSPTREFLAVSEEVAGSWVTPQQFKELYEYAVSRHGHGFLTIRLKSKNPGKMFAADFSSWIQPN